MLSVKPLREFAGWMWAGVLVASLAPAQEKFEPLFNGHDLTGWKGRTDLWSVKDGQIVGTTEGQKLERNTFLVWQGGELGDFHLKAKLKVVGDNNSGIQYRSVLEDPEKFFVAGNQCDVHKDPDKYAMLYSEKTGRGIVAKRGEQVTVGADGKPKVIGQTCEQTPVQIDGWNEIEIIAVGNHVQHKLNGVVSVDVVDDHPQARRTGIIALQVHVGKPFTTYFKEIVLRKLEAKDAATAFAPVPKLPPKQVAQADNPAKKDPPAKDQAKKNPKKKDNAPKPDPVKKDEPKKAMPKVEPVKQEPTKKEEPKPELVKKENDKKDKKDRRKDDPGPAIRANKATPIERVVALKDFKVELIHSVPAENQGSWVNLCVDGKGRIIASDQYGGLFRFAPPTAGKPLDPATIEKVPADIRAANGLLWFKDALYVAVNDYENIIDSGLYKLTDSDGDDKLDKVEKLRPMQARGDHGVHAIVPTPDGEAFYLITGNGTKPTEFNRSRVPTTWGEDHLLPRMPDGRGFMRDVLGPGGIIYRVTPDAKDWEVVSSGYRNIFDASVNRDGELFTYDADMEYDFNTSWYRPTRVCHVVSGSEYGWRNGAGKRFEWYPDNLPPVLNIGPGSPTGTTFGYGAKFPAKHQNALYILDWSWGKIYAVHLKPDGATYTATKEDFVYGSPLPVTDAIIHPGDGAMYFAIGGRKVQSGLYRVTYAGSESTAPAQAEANTSNEFKIRKLLEGYHQPGLPTAVTECWPWLGHEDRFIRWAARVAIEHQDPALWTEKALVEPSSQARLEALLALAHATGICPQHRKKDAPPVDQKLGDRIFDSLASFNLLQIPVEQQICWGRNLEIVLNRFGRPDEALAKALIGKMDLIFPSSSFELNTTLCETMVYLQAPTAATKGIFLLNSAATQEEQIEYARSLRHLREGWTIPLRTSYFEWMLKAGNYHGGASFEKFVENIRTDALETLTEEEKSSLAELLARKPVKIDPLALAGEMLKDRQPVKEYAIADLAEHLAKPLTNRNFERGKKLFAATGCYNCHRFVNAGGMTGPDLSSAGRRFNPRDLVEQVTDPSKVINDQYVGVKILMTDGKVVNGLICNLNRDSISVNTDLTKPDLRVNVDRKEVELMENSKVSLMPKGLLDRLQVDEILDLAAYLISGGDPKNPAFKQ